MLGSIKRLRPWMRPVIFVKREQLVDRASFIVGVINLRVSGIKNFWSRSVWTLFLRPMMAKTVTIVRHVVARFSDEIELFLLFSAGAVLCAGRRVGSLPCDRGFSHGDV